MTEKFLLQAPAGDLKHYNPSLPILFSLPLHLPLPHFKTAHLQMILFPFPICACHSHFPSPPLEPHPPTRSWRSASAITTMPSCSPSERLTVTASRRSSSSRNRSSKHSALNWRMRAKPCWVSSPLFSRDLSGPFFGDFAACCTLGWKCSHAADAKSGLSTIRSKPSLSRLDDLL